VNISRDPQGVTEHHMSLYQPYAVTDQQTNLIITFPLLDPRGMRSARCERHGAVSSSWRKHHRDGREENEWCMSMDARTHASLVWSCVRLL